jgi:predicted RNA-binding Zn ribbon-like protein
VVNSANVDGQAAPAGLEPVRALLNTWLIPNDSRRPADNFAAFARDQRWQDSDETQVRELRDDLRYVVENKDANRLNQWIERTGIRPAVAGDAIVYRHDAGPAGDFLAMVLAAVGAGTWQRLKACPDCHWVFYDNTRNGSKRWCLMYAGGPDGRACGTIAKVRRYRARQAAAEESGAPSTTRGGVSNQEIS